MAKKKEPVILEDVELKPQVIGYAYEKKSNLGRVIIIFIILIVAVFYINDITVFINNLLGKKTPSTITEGSGKPSEGEKPGSEQPGEDDTEYNLFNESLEIKSGSLTLNNFKYANNTLTFDINNSTTSPVNLSSRKYFLETYTEDKTLINRFKVDIDSILGNNKESYTFNEVSSFSYLVFVEKTTKDYPEYALSDSENGIGDITCKMNDDTYIYSFEKNKLTKINHTISNSNVSDASYYNKYNEVQTLVNNYKTMEGMTATFNGTQNGYSAVITIDLEKVDLSKVNNKYYYAKGEEAKVVDFEMITYGYTCS